MAQVYDIHLDNKCAVCKDIVEITEGAVLYDVKWYHQKCWEENEDGSSTGS